MPEPIQALAQTFQIAGGTVTGWEHKRIGRNNQDAHEWAVTDRCIIALVGDGCGSHKHSEVGAKIGVRTGIKSILDAVNRLPAAALGDAVTSRNFWERIRQDLLMHIRVTALSMGGSLSQTINDYFLFTMIGALITEEVTIQFGIGDGIHVLNGDLVEVGPFAKNEPPYVSYGITGSAVIERDPNLAYIQIHRQVPTSNVESLLIGSDGVSFLMKAAEKPLPGKQELVGPLDQFWTQGQYFENPDQVRRRLWLASQDTQRVDWETRQIHTAKSLLKDDTTFVVLRRRPVIA